jgi:hypothetical protein
MITGPRVKFNMRCVERGYTLDEVRPCIVSEDGDTITVDTEHPAYPRARPGLSAVQKAVNFATSAARHVAAGAPRCTEEQVAARHAICSTCEFLKNGSCEKCGCPVVRERAYISKLSWAGESCPAGKWGPVSPAG